MGGEFHEGQLWEEVIDDLVISEKHAQMTYEWLKTRLTSRSSQRMLPQGMPETIEEVTVETKRDGKAGYIWFTPNDSLAVPMKKMDVQVYIEYEYGSMKVEMGEACTIRMLAQEFWELTQRQWEFYPINGYRRTLDRSVVHKVTTDLKEYQAIAKQESMVVAPVKVLEERGRGTEIHSVEDQGKLLQYWAWFQQPMEVGVLFPEENHTIEYWMNSTLQPVHDESDPLTYHRVLKEMWTQRLRGISPGVGQRLEMLGEDFGARVRHLYNGLRVWFAPNDSIAGGLNGSLAEDPCPKDKWYSWTDIMAFTYPTLPDCQVKEEPTILFGKGSRLQERYDDAEVQGGKIALIAFKRNKVQKPPNCLDRMHSTFLKQVSYNERVIEAEKEISGINCDVADFLSGMALDPEDQLVICVNGSEETKRNEEAVGGQLWMQGDRQMTAYNRVLEGMANSRESAVISATADAATWKHALESEEGPRKGQRVVIYPKDLPQLDAVLSTGDPNIDSEDGHPIAYTAILQAAQSHERPSLFLREDSEQITRDPVMSEKVPGWMNTAAQVATGNRRRVLEDAPDKMNADEEDAAKEEHGDELTGMYTPGVTLESAKMTQAQVAAQKAAAQAQKKIPPDSQSPVGGSSDDDDPARADEWIWSQTKGCMRRNKFYKAPTATASPEKVTSSPSPKSSLASIKVPHRPPTPVNIPTDPPSPKSRKPTKKAAASQKAPAVQKPVLEAKASNPMETRRQAASRAGGLRSVGSSGQAGTCVASGNPPKT
jgi:hypothetical protein